MIPESLASAGAGYPVELVCQVRLEDGTVAAIRPICPGDANSLDDFHEHLSGDTVYRRFFNAHPHLQSAEIQRFTHVDYCRRLALVAEIDGQLSAVARYDRDPDGDQAEVAFVVADALQGKGLGSLLLEHLALAARRRGVSSFLAHTLGNNYPMQNVFRHAGFDCQQHWSDGVIEVSFPIAPTQLYLEAVLERELRALGPQLIRAPVAGGGGLGVAGQTAAAAEMVRSACHSAGLDVASPLVTDELGVDPGEAVLYLALDTECEVVVVESVELRRPHRFVAVAREGARHRPVVLLTPAGAATAWCAQAGVDLVHRVEDLVDRVRELTLERRKGTWSAPHRGSLVELSDCNVAQARAVLDEAAPGRRGETESPVCLPPGPTGEVLAAYGITVQPAGRPGHGGEPYLVVEDQPGLGLLARLGSRLSREASSLSALLPLTDRDAEELVEAARLSYDSPELTDELVLRATRLIDDQPDVAQVRIPLHPVFHGDGPEVWTGRVRGTDDDPFVRRLALGLAGFT
jgi:GNAT superfamily N-acetyltransferase